MLSAGFVSNEATVVDAFHEPGNTAACVWNCMTTSRSAGVAATNGRSDIEIYQCMSSRFWYPITVKVPDIIRIAAWRDACDQRSRLWRMNAAEHALRTAIVPARSIDSIIQRLQAPEHRSPLITWRAVRPEEGRHDE